MYRALSKEIYLSLIFRTSSYQFRNAHLVWRIFSPADLTLWNWFFISFLNLVSLVAQVKTAPPSPYDDDEGDLDEGGGEISPRDVVSKIHANNMVLFRKLEQMDNESI